jgi:hypothetical protein
LSAYTIHRNITERKLIAEVLQEAHIELKQRVEERTVELGIVRPETKKPD